MTPWFTVDLCADDGNPAPPPSVLFPAFFLALALRTRSDSCYRNRFLIFVLKAARFDARNYLYLRVY